MGGGDEGAGEAQVEYRVTLVLVPEGRQVVRRHGTPQLSGGARQGSCPVVLSALVGHLKAKASTQAAGIGQLPKKKCRIR
jgi:hypothetical protein